MYCKNKLFFATSPPLVQHFQSLIFNLKCAWIAVRRLKIMMPLHDVACLSILIYHTIKASFPIFSSHGTVRNT